jgi:glycosyltransferase involved in cell wall biosynthesis
MYIAAITIGSYPKGEATTNRNISILKGLAQIGNIVDLYVLSPTDKVCKDKREKKGTIENISYEYTSFTVNWPKSIIIKTIILSISVINALYKLNTKHKSGLVDTIILQLSKPYLMHPFILFAKLKGIKVYHQQDETPEIIFKNKISRFIFYPYYTYIINNLTGLYVISKYLNNYFANLIDNNNICLVNMIVDHNRFIYNKQPFFDFQYIAYCGTMYGDKDGIIDLIDAYMLIESVTKLKLVLIGDITDKRADYVKNKVRDSKLGDRIILTGSIGYDDIPKYLQNADILALARPDNLQARGGFPTKLGEYLLTEKPIVITAVGDIPDFITDGVNGFLVEPGNPNLFASKLLYVINNYNLALEVAKNGKALAMEYFNYSKEATKLFHFMMNHK